MKNKSFFRASVLLSFWVNSSAQEYDISTSIENALQSKKVFNFKVDSDSATVTETGEYANLAGEQFIRRVLAINAGGETATIYVWYKFSDGRFFTYGVWDIGMWYFSETGYNPIPTKVQLNRTYSGTHKYFGDYGGAGDFPIDRTESVSTTFKGIETITVPTGTFKALKYTENETAVDVFRADNS